MGNSSSSDSVNYDALLFADTKPRSIEVAGSGSPGNATWPRRHPSAKDQLLAVPTEDDKPDGYKTGWECFQRSVTKFPNNTALGTRVYEVDSTTNEVVKNKDKTEKRGKFVYDTYKEVDELARDFGAGLVKLGAKQNDNIGIFSNNRAEWQISNLGFMSQNMRTIALYATLGEDAVEYIINHAEMKIVVVSKENIKNLIKVLGKVKLSHVIQYDVNPKYQNLSENVDAKDVEACAAHKVQLLGFSDVIKTGKDSGIFPNLPRPEDIANIMYTSGTTGNPKGVILRHSNMTAAIAAVPFIFKAQPTDVLLSYLPLAHIFECALEAVFLFFGATICYSQGNVKKLTEDIFESQPTLLPGVPRVFTRFYQKVFEGVDQKMCLVRYFFHKMYNNQAALLRTGKPRDESIHQKFAPIREKLGLNRLRTIITGAAPCPPYLFEFLRVIFGCAVIQGYGMTETSAALSATEPDDGNVGHCGPPVPCAEIKLVDIPEMNYLSTDKPHPRGEIWVRGPANFAGYYKDPTATSETLKEDGWLATGDVGRFNPNGTVSVIDRKKNLFKLSQGEYVAAEKVETTYAQCGWVGQIWIYGNSFKSTLVGVVVPAAETLYAFCKEKGWWPTAAENVRLGDDQFIADFKTVLTGEHAAELKKQIRDQMKTVESSLKGFEKVSDIIVESVIDNKTLAGFTEANGCLTPTFKLRRVQLLAKYMKELKQSYAQHGEPDKPNEKWPGEV